MGFKFGSVFLEHSHTNFSSPFLSNILQSQQRKSRNRNHSKEPVLHHDFRERPREKYKTFLSRAQESRLYTKMSTYFVHVCKFLPSV